MRLSHGVFLYNYKRMKIIASCVVISAILIFGIYMSGGIDTFLANLMSTGVDNESEIIDLNTPQESANITDAVGAKKSKITQQVSQKPKCIVTGSGATHLEARINEVAWMGSENDATREWIELKNISPNVISLSGWELLDKSGRIDMQFGANTSILPNNFLVLSRGREFTGTINNSDETLSLFDGSCVLVDIVSANPSWPSGDTKSGKTAERGEDFSWHTSLVSGGTPGKENSIPAIAQVSSKNSTSLQSSATASIATSAATTISGPVPSGQADQSSNAQPLKVLISEVMMGMNGNANYDFVELYNNSDSPALLTGLSIKKKSSTGKESSLVAESRLTGKTISEHGYFLLANDSGYAGSVKADVIWPSSYSLAASKNGIVLYDANNKAIDSATWDTIPDGASFVRDGWSSTVFHINSTPTPQNSLSH